MKLAALVAGIAGVLILVNERTCLAAGSGRPEGGGTQSVAVAAADAQPADEAVYEDDLSYMTVDEPGGGIDAAEDGGDSLPAVDVSAWNLRLVSSESLLPATYEPELMYIEGDEQFDARAGEYLLELIGAAREAGYSVYVCSCYRTYDTQYEIYMSHIDEYQQQGMTLEQAKASTLLAVCCPGGSEHQLGLAADLLESDGQEMEPWIGGSGLMLWLEENCAKYGFIIRYPNGKTDITGVEYEPWHVRYVGNEAAEYIMENGLCLEEFLALYE